jgi:pimeloyl-ACP methyl ester carboxylesterase
MPPKSLDLNMTLIDYRAPHAPAQDFDEITFTARDGLQLYARHYQPRDEILGAKQRPVVCLPGITRNSRDFHLFATALSLDPVRPRSVYTLDARGRGRSQHDPDWKNYSVPIEMLDVLDFLTLRSLSKVALVGTSRGGIIAMLMAAAQPSALGCVVLNDIGPVIESDGLSRIAGYLGRVPLPHSWADAGRMVRDMNHKQFPRVSETEWIEVARQFFNEAGGKPAAGYDPKLSHSLSVLDGPMPALWPQFEAMKRVPLMVLRGENSDILSAATVEEMRRRHPRITAHAVRWEGHAPLLRDPHTIGEVSTFIASCDPGLA